MMYNIDFIAEFLTKTAKKIDEKKFQKETTFKVMEIATSLSYILRDKPQMAKITYALGKMLSLKIETEPETEEKTKEFIAELKKIL